MASRGAAFPLRIMHGLVTYIMSGKSNILLLRNVFRLDLIIGRSQCSWHLSLVPAEIEVGPK